MTYEEFNIALEEALKQTSGKGLILGQMLGGLFITCPFCLKNGTVMDFKDQLGVREFTVSGLCQKCQDECFGDDTIEE